MSVQLAEQNILRGRHCVFKLLAHLVFVTQYWRGVLTLKYFDKLKVIFSKGEDFQATLVALDGEGDHAHLLLEYPPQV